MIAVSDFVPAYTLVALALEQLVGQKIAALLSRKKARDFYDLYFISFRGGNPPIDRREEAAFSFRLKFLLGCGILLSSGSAWQVVRCELRRCRCAYGVRYVGTPVKQNVNGLVKKVASGLET
jgi:hypothetical protein